MFTPEFIISQIFGLIALLFMCLSYSFNSRIKFLTFQILVNVFYAASFFTLSVWIAGANTIVSIIRVLILYVLEKKGKNPPVYLLIIFSAIYITIGVIGIIKFKNPLDVIPIITSLLYNFAMFIKNIKITRLITLIPSAMLVVFDIVVMTYTNALIEIIALTTLLISIYRYSKFRELKKHKYLI